MGKKKAVEIERTMDEHRLNYLLSELESLVDAKIEDIESGVEEGLYEDSDDNKEELARLNDVLATIKEQKESRPKVYLYIEGGMIQGVSASVSLDWNQYDKDCEDDDDEYVENNGTSDEWDAEVEKLTKEGIIRPFI